MATTRMRRSINSSSITFWIIGVLRVPVVHRLVFELFPAEVSSYVRMRYVIVFGSSLPIGWPPIFVHMT